MKSLKLWQAASLGALALMAGLACSTASAASWKFGVISDTQWVDNPDDGYSPNSIPAGIIKQIDQAFIAQGVNVVISVGDTVDVSSKTNLDTRALLAQDLYNAGIGFYMMRGNHEDGLWTGSVAGSGLEITRIFPQQLDGTNNLTPEDCTASLITNSVDLVNLQIPANTGSPFVIGSNFSSPTNVFNGVPKTGLTYAFDYNNVRFVLLDMFDDSSNNKMSVIPQQQPWITSVLADPARPQHAFVFTHKNLLGGQHKDNLFGTTVSSADPGDCTGVNYSSLSVTNQTLFNFKQQGEDAFISSLATNNVHYMFCGHDHHHYDSIVQSPLGTNKVHQIILASDSNKFYVPQKPVSTNDTPISQQLNTVGYYIVTVDGDKATVDYYAVDITGKNGFVVNSATENTISTTPTLTGNWKKVLTSGYSVNGQEFVIPQGASYTAVVDSTAKAVALGETGYVGTTAQILGGINASTAKATNSLTTLRPLSKAVDTGWTPAASGAVSDVLTLWGLTEIGANKADTYALSLSYDAAIITPSQISSGALCIATKDAFGHWVNTVDMNIGGKRQFVLGAYSSGYPLGTYGVDTTSQTVWAVVNHQGDFAAATASAIVNFVYTSDNHYGIVRPLFRGNFNVTGQAVNEAMIARMNTLPVQLFPNDGGVAAGQSVGTVDFLMDTGDIANRSESQSAIAANAALDYLGSIVNYPGNSAYTAPVSSVTWSQWQHDYLGDTNTGSRAGGLLTLTNAAGQGIPVFLSPGNHDVSDAIGMNGKIAAGNVDATSFAQIYNRMTPYSGKLPITTNIFTNPGDYTNVNNQVNYSFDIGGVHVLCVNMFPDKNILNWMSADIANLPTSTPVFLFCHVPLNMAAGETKVFGTPTNTSNSAGADIPFKLSGTDSANSYVDMNAAKQYVADWLVAHGNVRALFSGHDNFNGATNWNGQDANGNLIAVRDSVWPGVTLFRVDSPMKGDVSGVSSTSGSLAGIGNETNLSFQVFSLDVANRKLTEREFQWNPTADATGNGVWSGQSVTIDLNFPSSPATLAGPANGATVNAYPTLAWSAVDGATSYLVTLVGPAGTNYYTATGTSLPLTLAQSGAYSWTVMPLNATGSGSVSVANTFSVASGAWSFGVIDDTQWTCTNDPAGLNPNGVPVSIINQINPQFINAGVKFVVQIGDLTENGEDADEAVRATAAQPLLDAGIGFFPMRGNHETYSTNNNSFAIPAFHANYPQTRGLTNTFGAANFNSPTNVSMDLDGMSYSFDFGTPDSSARFVILDNWVTMTRSNGAAGYPYGYSFGDQQDWISGQLNKNTRGAQHAFVFSHQPLIAENHQDSPFVGYTDANTNMQNAFFASLQTNGVRYYISGHDHVHQHSIITSPDGFSQVEEIIGASDSSKFYTPKAVSNTNWFGQKVRELSLSQDRYTVGYYIYTVDGPRVTVDYYADDHGNWSSDNQYPTATSTNLGTHVTPTFHFVKKETFGYSLNGQSFLVAQGQAYTNVQGSIAAGGGYLGTAAKILGGVNASTTLDGSARPLTKQVSTGWTPANDTASDILTLWGMTEVGKSKADAYALSLNYNPAAATAAQLANGLFGLVSKDTNGAWVNAVNLNTGGNAQFVFGPYVSSYSLGTYGVDTNSGTVWAVVNYQGNFAAGAVTNRTNFSALRIATLSDIHYMDPSLLVADGSAFQTYLAGDRKLLAESAAIDKAAIDAVIAQQPDILLVNGDETKDGEYVSHLAVSNLLARVAASGTMVYVIPGNHDVNNANAKSFDGSIATPVANVTPEQFSAIYAPFGYNQAIAKDPNSLAYVVEPVSGLWILCMDSCQYTGGQNPTEGSFTAQRLSWITNELAQAQASGKVVIGMMHHGLLEHFTGQKTLFSEYVVDNYQTVASLFASYGMKLVFTGHFHAQDIAQGTFNGNTIYDIETGSAVTYPCPYRVIDLQANGQLVINSHRVSSINYNLGSAPDFQTYAYNYLTNGMVPLSAYMLQLPPFSLDSDTANYLAPAVSEALVDHYIGDEPGLAGATPVTQAIVSGLLAGSPQQRQLGGAIYSILTDTAPADNNLTLNLTAGQITGPATNTVIMSGTPTLTWAPVWGAGSYHVTVTGPGYSRSFDVTGTSLALSGLSNGAYNWTVTPDTGSVSSTGGFALDYPPTLGIEPSTNGTVHVYWPVSSLSSYQLQFSPDLSGTNWVNVSSNGFFRLMKP